MINIQDRIRWTKFDFVCSFRCCIAEQVCLIQFVAWLTGELIQRLEKVARSKTLTWRQGSTQELYKHRIVGGFEFKKTIYTAQQTDDRISFGQTIVHLQLVGTIQTDYIGFLQIQIFDHNSNVFIFTSNERKSTLAILRIVRWILRTKPFAQRKKSDHT